MRCVVLVGPAGSGKSTLAAALLRAAGAPPPDDVGPGRLSYGTVGARGAGAGGGAGAAGGARVHLLDPPGDPDLAGELAGGLRAATGAVFVLSPVQGIDPRTVQTWRACEAAGLPRLVVLTQLDRPGADADEAVAVCRRVLGDGVLPVHLPLHADDGAVRGLLDLLRLRVSDLSGGARVEREPEAEHLPLVEGLRDDLLEAVLAGSEDQELFDRWLAGAALPASGLARELGAAVGRGDVQPVTVAVPDQGVGLAELLDLLGTALPDASARPCPTAAGPDGAPVEPLEPDPRARTVAEVVRSGPGPVSLLRVWSGTRGDGCGPGALCVVDEELPPGHLVCDPGEPLVLEPWSRPPAVLPEAAFPVGVAVDPGAAVDPGVAVPSGGAVTSGVAQDPGLARRVDQDPVARLAVEARTGQLLLWSLGPRHAELLLEGRPAAPVVVPPGGRPVLLRLRVPAWSASTVRSDLAGRGGSVLSVAGDDEDGSVVLEAQLPPQELPGYALALARATAHTGSLRRT